MTTVSPMMCCISLNKSCPARLRTHVSASPHNILGYSVVACGTMIEVTGFRDGRHDEHLGEGSLAEPSRLSFDQATLQEASPFANRRAAAHDLLLEDNHRLANDYCAESVQPTAWPLMENIKLCHYSKTGPQ